MKIPFFVFFSDYARFSRKTVVFIIRCSVKNDVSGYFREVQNFKGISINTKSPKQGLY